MKPATRINLAPGYSISRVIKGGWQLAGGHGAVDRAAAISDMDAYVDAGITTFDCADIYTGVEEMIGAFRQDRLRRHGHDSLAQLKIHTKFVPDLAVLPTIDRALVERTIDRSLARLGVERLDLVQFHWWDYRVPGYLDTASWLADLQRAGKIDRLGGTNFDTARAREVSACMPMVSMQVQYSLLDQRPRSLLAPFCIEAGMQLLCYGSVAGGFLSERWLGVAEPAQTLENRSLIKVQADHRRLRRLGSVPASADEPAAGRASPRRLDPDGRDELGAAAAGGRSGDRRRAPRRPSSRTICACRVSCSMTPTSPFSRLCCRNGTRPSAMPTRSSETSRVAMAA